MMQNHVAVCWLALLGLACPGLVASSLLNARGPGARAILEGPRTDRVYCVAYSPDGKTLASAGNFCHDVTERPRRYGGEVLLWDVHTRKVKVQLKPKAGWEDGTSVRAVSFSPDGKTLAAAGRLRYPERPGGGAIILWDVQTGREKASFKGHEREAVWVAFSPDGKTLVSIGYGQEITLWDVEAGKERAGFKGSGYRCCFSPDSKSLAVVRPG